MEVLIPVVVFVGALVATCLWVYAQTLRRQKIRDRLTAATFPPMAQSRPVARAQFGEWAKQISKLLPLAPGDVAVTRRNLTAAGYSSETAIHVFYALKVLLGFGFTVFALLVRRDLTDNPVLQMVFPVVAALAGFFGTNLVLERLVERRRRKLRLALPDALDLMVVCVEAGVGLDQALLKVGRELEGVHPVLSQELATVNFEMRAGASRADALRGLATRTGSEDLRKLVSLLIQTDRFGTSMAESLRSHSDFMRIRRRQEAEERAAKVGVKLVFPIFFFLLPAMLVVAAGPGLLQLFKNLFPLMRDLQL
jgi:tight adherence protein C